ncbi:hypothetical protein K443DRAFT_308519 [Laccaria amethystina LaAM-08-1]|uniref:Unplaced genomic scaffold K443scaffold_20, whole genome shotgun sequence n=1 Tax=Laccaria amethystina LaAM-08-1 TaxID=1095629 RepID=A0A0C9X1U2_9AGAR|nr:hypothetical protein K443DRAFT_308519 [Laccaria amethystina LaAM-08-1]
MTFVWVQVSMGWGGRLVFSSRRVAPFCSLYFYASLLLLIQEIFLFDLNFCLSKYAFSCTLWNSG